MGVSLAPLKTKAVLQPVTVLSVKLSYLRFPLLNASPCAISMIPAPMKPLNVVLVITNYPRNSPLPLIA